MQKEDFYYDLPEELIAQVPLLNRTSSRLMVLNKAKKTFEHKIFEDIIDYLSEGDCLVLNNTKVIPARIYGRKYKTSAKVQLLLLKKHEKDVWETLAYPGKKVKIGDKLIFGNDELLCEVLDILEGGNRLVKFNYEGIFEEILDRLGEMPLPPYIKEKLDDKNRYQTVYAEHDGSAAAPTAGFHFTQELLEKISRKNVSIAYVTLHVGLGTFRPVKVSNINEHIMHEESYEVLESQASIMNEAKKAGKKIICVGTTSCRTIETCANEDGFIIPQKGKTGIFIYPGYKFKAVDMLITNFHLPESTLLMLVSAFSDRDFMLNSYKEAIKEKYRFFSFGDVMLIGNISN